MSNRNIRAKVCKQLQRKHYILLLFVCITFAFVNVFWKHNILEPGFCQNAVIKMSLAQLGFLIMSLWPCSDHVWVQGCMGNGNKIRAMGRNLFFFFLLVLAEIRVYYSSWKRAQRRGDIIQWEKRVMWSTPLRDEFSAFQWKMVGVSLRSESPKKVIMSVGGLCVCL